ncbi:MAG: SDR family NAD(P)-dependent oxidoreductase [Balneolaceae bacterium]
MGNDNAAARSFENCKAVITGGSSGIGWEITQQLREKNAVTTIVDINAPPQAYSGLFFRVDLQKPKKLDAVYDSIIEKMGTPNILVLNAGKGIHEKLTEGDPDLWEDIFRLNLFSNMRLIRAFSPDMLEQETGDIVFISSVSARKAFEYGGIYGASKAAVDMIAETLRLEVQPTLRVTTIHPGVVNTSFFENMIHGSQTPESIGWGSVQPKQVADAVMYALSQPADIALNDIVIRPAGQPL